MLEPRAMLHLEDLLLLAPIRTLISGSPPCAVILNHPCGFHQMLDIKTSLPDCQVFATWDCPLQLYLGPTIYAICYLIDEGLA